MLGIIDYKVVNLGSILNILKKIGAKDVVVITRPDQLDSVSKILLPGIGSFDKGVTNLQEIGLWEPLRKRIGEDKIPCLGICLGMQLLTHRSEEGTLPGLGLVNAEVKKFRIGLRVPHMGWNHAVPSKVSKLTKDLPEKSRFYFVHSYYVNCFEEKDVLLRTNYEHSFAAAFELDNIYGVQFHPEKSHRFGMKILENFVRL